MTAPRPVRDCRCPVAQHRHGTDQAYNLDRCRCGPCSTAHTRTSKRQRLRAARRESAGLPVGLTDGHGTRRRLQALAVLGWSTTRLAVELNTSQQRISELQISDSRVQAQLAARVAALYDRLWNTRPDWPGSTRARTAAIRRGWVPPMAWDDDEIDTPAAKPHTPGDGPHEAAPCGTQAAARRHYRRGEPLDAACRLASCIVKNDRMARRRAA